MILFLHVDLRQSRDFFGVWTRGKLDSWTVSYLLQEGEVPVLKLAISPCARSETLHVSGVLGNGDMKA